ncbi:MAG: LPP20 family lipoprotein [Sulfurimonas sp.]|uniref:LPP20 family lipoprotein n=1 Tax=Sulfurimonas sp. TaxID=2022749 RepID=UPI0025F38CB8|nr:LPP20 family lipoprotein [Sulfurimonas sp.]MCK9491524.1 LPP20 family lipoprotein [Sulfurimonas sp.]
MKYSLLLIALSACALVANTPKSAQTIGDYDKINSIETQVLDIDTKVTSVETQVSDMDTKVNSVERKLASMESTVSKIKQTKEEPKEEQVLKEDLDIRISVVGQGVAPMNTSSPAQAYALAKRAATADAYRLIAEKVKGVRIDGQDLIKNMMVKRSTIRTSVKAMVRNANVVETTFKEGLCEVEMEIVLSHAQFSY